MKERDDELGEQEVEQSLGDDEFPVSLDENHELDFHGQQPPEVSEEELQRLDDEAMLTEVSKLKSLGAVEEAKSSEVDFSDLKEVFDWRFREGAWKSVNFC